MILNHAIWGRDVITGYNDIQDLLTSYDKVDIYGGSTGTTIDKLWGRNLPLSFNDIYHMTSSNYFPSWTPETYMYAEFEGDIEAGNIKGLTERITYWNLYRQEVKKLEDGSFTSVGKFFFLDRIPKDVKTYTDYTATRQKYYRYYLFAQTETQYSIPATLPEIKSEYYGYYLVDMVTNQTFKIDIGVTGGDQTINMKYSQYDTNTKYNAIQTAVTNYKSGTIGGLLIDNNDRDKFENSIDLLESFRDFVYRDGVKYLKTRKGEMFNIFLSDYNETLVEQGIKNQPMVSNFSWREINDVIQPIEIQQDINAYRLYFNGNYKEAPNIESKYVKYETAVGILPNITRRGYTFSGWFTEAIAGSKVISTTILTGTNNKVIYAHWTVNTYSIKFDKNSSIATGSMTNQVVKWDTTVMLKDNTFIVPLHEFKEWNTTPNGSGTSYDDIAFVSNLTDINNDVITLYAQWTKVRKIIKFWEVGNPRLSDIRANLYDDGVLEFVGKGKLKAYNRGGTPWEADKGKILSAKFIGNITSSSFNSIFVGMNKMKRLENYPENLSNLREAFIDCSSLVYVPDFPDKINNACSAFVNCTSLVNAPNFSSNPADVVIIYEMFKGCTSLLNVQDITLENNIDSNLRNVFEGCTSLVTSPKIHMKYYPELPYTFKGCTSLIDVQEISSLEKGSNVALNNTFENCTSLEQAPYVSPFITMFSSSFKGCVNLLNAPSYYKGIEKMFEAFDGCSDLRSYPMVSPAMNDARFAFKDCISLTGNMKFLGIVDEDLYREDCFFRCSTNTSANLIVDYIESNKNFIDDIIATKSSNSNIRKGVQLPTMVLETWNIGNPILEDVTATLYSSGLLEFTGSGNMRVYDNYRNVPWYSLYKKHVNKVVFDITLEPLDLSNYFYECIYLKTVNLIPSSVVKMESTFYGCSSLTGDMLIESIINQYDNCFKECSTNASANLIVDYTDNNATMIDAIIATKSTNSHITKKAKYIQMWEIGDPVKKDVTVTLYKDGLLEFKGIGNTMGVSGVGQIWGDKTNLIKTVSFQNTVKTVRLSNYFSECASLTSVINIPDSVTEMRNTFYKCNSLISTPIIPNSVPNIAYAFSYCTSLVNVSNIPSGAIDMENTFNGCTKLVNVPIIPNSVTNMKRTFLDCASLNITPAISSSVTDMQDTFNGCSLLSFINVTIPASVAYLYRTFYDCHNLTGKIFIKTTATEYANMFAGCSTNIDDVLIIDYIDDNAEIVDSMIDTKSENSNIIKKPRIVKTYNIGSPTATDVIATLYNNGLLDITGTGNTVVMAGNSQRWANEVNLIKSVKFSNTVTPTVLNYYFMNCVNLTNINIIPNAVIDMLATFQGCTSLVNVPTIPNAVTTIGLTFKNCTSLVTAPTIPNGVRSMDSTFQNCTSLVSAPIIPDNVTNMSNTFYGCTSLINAPIIPDNVTNMSSTFSNCTSLVTAPIIPNSVTSMNNTFQRCSSLINVLTIPNNVTEMNNTFKYCVLLIDAPIIPNGVTNMNGTFYGCTKLINVPKISNSTIHMYETFYNCTSLIDAPIIPDSVTHMDNTFSYCASLVIAPIIPNGVTSMSGTFYSCTSLTNAPIIPNGVTSMYNTFQGCASLIDAPTIPNGVVTMGGTFASCKKIITAPYIPDSVTDMSSTFRGCTSLINAPTIPNSVTDVGSIFYDCTSLTTAPNIPNNATDVNQAFNGCVLLTGKVTINANPTVYYRCFEECSTDSTANLIVNYVSENELIIDDIIATKSSDSHITKGNNMSQVSTIATYDIGNPNATDVTATLYSDGLFEITGTGDTKVFLANNVLWVLDENANKIKKIKMDNSVRPVNLSYYFYNCSSLTDISELILPDSVTNMTYMFYRCSSLEDISSFVIPSGAGQISYLFRDCTSLTNISNLTLPGVERMGVVDLIGIFRGCTSLVEIPSTFKLPTGKTFVNISFMFLGCTSLEDASKFNIPNGVQQMGNIFQDCVSLTGTFRLNCTGAQSMFKNCSTKEGTNLIVNYTSSMASSIDSTITTKSPTSHITKGVQVL